MVYLIVLDHFVTLVKCVLNIACRPASLTISVGSVITSIEDRLKLWHHSSGHYPEDGGSRPLRNVVSYAKLLWKNAFLIVTAVRTADVT
jgi:hypothetical protein